MPAFSNASPTAATSRDYGHVPGTPCPRNSPSRDFFLIPGSCFIISETAAVLAHMRVRDETESGMIFALFKPKREREFSRIEKALSRMTAGLQPGNERYYGAIDKAEEKLWHLLGKDEGVANILSEFCVTQDFPRSIYRELIEIGAGQIRGGRFVPVAALIEPKTLAYCLSVLAADKPNQDDKEEMGYNLLMYFEGRHTDMHFSKTKFPSR